MGADDCRAPKTSSRGLLADLEEIFMSLLGQRLLDTYRSALSTYSLGDFQMTTIGDWTWKIFQVRDMALFPPEFRDIVVSDRSFREHGFVLLRSLSCHGDAPPLQEVAQPVLADMPWSEPAEVIVAEAPIPQPASSCSPSKPTKGSSTKKPRPKTQAMLSSNLAKISSFFSVITKAPLVEKVQSDYFPAYQLRPNSTAVGWNQFERGPGTLGDKGRIVRIASRSAVARPFWLQIYGANRRKLCTCFGPDGTIVLAAWKLLSFYEDYRPAYYGTQPPA